MRGRETHNQTVGYSNPEDLSCFYFFLVKCFLHNIGILIKTVAALLVTSVSKFTSGREAGVGT